MLISVVVVLTLLTLLVACQPSQPTTPTPPSSGEQPPTPPPAPTKDKIVVGMSRPLSGWNATIGDSAYRPVYETFVEEVNADGGVYLSEYGKKLPIELLIYDDKSDVGTMTRLTEKLIVEDKVDFLWPASGTSFLFAQAPIANKYEYVLITAEGGASSIMDMLPSMPYVFVTLSFSNWYQIPVLAEILADAGAKTAYVTYIADLHGIEYSGQAGIDFPSNGIDIVGVKSLPPEMKDFSPVIKEAKALNPDVYCVFGYPDQVLPTTAQAMELQFNPKAIIGGPGVNFGFYQTTFGPITEGVMGFTTFNPKQSDAAAELAHKLYDNRPPELTDWWGHPLYWAGLEFWKQAVEEVGSTDQAALQEVVTNSTFETVLGPTWFENGLLSKDCHTGEIGQWQNGEFEVVGPTNWATADLIYPKPAWP